MKRAILLLLLCPALAQAATFTTNFESVPGSLITDLNTCRLVGTVTNGGITATFGSAWALARAVTTIPVENRSCTGFGTMADNYWGGIPVGLFRNAPSGTKAARICWDCTYTPLPVEISFNHDIHFFSCYLSGSTKWNAWACGSPYLLRFEDSLHDFNVHAISQTDGGLVSGASIQLLDAGNVVRASTSPQLVDGWAGCTTEVPDGVMDYSSVLDPYCNWQYIEVYSASPIRKVRFNVGGRYFDPLYVDDIVATDGACPHPPCGFEGAAPVTDYVQVGGAFDGPLRVGMESAGSNVTISPLRSTPALRRSWGELKAIYR